MVKRGIGIKVILPIILAVLIAGGGCLYWFMFRDDTAEDITNSGGEFAAADDYAYLSDENYVSFGEEFTDVLVTDESSALEAIAAVASVLGITDVQNELKLARVDEVDGDKYYRFQQYYSDIPVYGRNVVVAADAVGTVAGMTSNTIEVGDVATDPAIGEGTAVQGVEDHYENIDSVEIGSLVIMSLNGITPQLAYQMTVFGYECYEECFVSAESGEVLYTRSIFKDATATVYSTDGKKSAQAWQNEDGTYMLYNEEYKIGVLDYREIDLSAVEIEESITSKNGRFDEEAINMLNNTIQYAEFFEDLGFDGFDQIFAAIYDDTKEMSSNACAGSTVENEKEVALIRVGINTGTSDTDVIAHEYTHAVSSSIVHWDGSNESGALSEAYSDIFGELIEQKIKGTAEPDWHIHGDNIGVSRRMDDPSSSDGNKKYPSTLSDIENAKTFEKDDKLYYKTTSTEGEDYNHFASTVISHAAYLMWNGVDGTESQRINSDDLAELWYRSLFFLHSDATFKQCATAVILAAKQMDLTPEQLNCVREAFKAVGLEPYALKGKVTDSVTREPIEGVVVQCISGDSTISVSTDENGVFNFTEMPEGEYTLIAQKDGYEERKYDRIPYDFIKLDTDFILRPLYAQAYMDYLLDNQSNSAGLVTYSVGEGRFALAKINDDDIPELLIINPRDYSRICTYDEEVHPLGIALSSTDMAVFIYNNIWYNGKGDMIDCSAITNKTYWEFFKASPYHEGALVQYATLKEEDGKYYLSEINLDSMTADQYYDYLYGDYLFMLIDDEMPEVTKAQYDAYLQAHGIGSSDFKRINEDDLYYITPDVIEEVLGPVE